MAEWQNGRNGGMAEWQNGGNGRNGGRMAKIGYIRTITGHTDTDDDDTLIIYSIDKPIGPTAWKSVQGCLLYHL